MTRFCGICIKTRSGSPPAKQVGPNASRNAQGLIKLARQDHYGRCDGRADHQLGVWGIADIFKGFGQSTVAKVGGTEISLNEFRQIYTDRLQQISRQFGRPLSPEQARAFGLDRQVLQQTIAEAALDEEARRLGLGQSDDQIRQLIMNDPNFKGVGGNFDSNRFQSVIRNFGYTEQRYVSEQRKVSLRRQITGTIGAGLEPPKAMLDVLTRFQNEQRAIEFVRLDAAQAGTIDAPSPEALAAYFEDHKVQFRAPEYRKIAFVVVSPEEIGKWSEVSDEDAKKAFDQRKDRLGTPEKRQIQQIVFPNAAEAQTARERLTGGTSFEDLGKERGLSASDVDLGLVTKSSLDPAVGDAASRFPPVKSASPSRAVSARRSSRSTRSSRALRRTMRALPPTSSARSPPSARASRSPISATRWKTSAAAVPA